MKEKMKMGRHDHEDEEIGTMKYDLPRSRPS